MNIEEKLMQALDDFNPRWALEWADQRDLLELALGTLRETALRLRVVRKHWPMIQAALQAGLVREVE